MDILKRAQELKDEIVCNRRYFHTHPEVGFALDGTVAYVKERLTEMGYEPKDCGDHGIVATVGGSTGGKCVLIRADMDALPMKELSGLPFASPLENAAHTCGHDTHTAMLLGAAKILKEMEAELPGTVKLMFQPAEELISGAKNMIDNGVLENPKVDAAFGIHTMALDPKGAVGYVRGGMFASADMFEIYVHGLGGHGAMPQLTVDPVNVAAHILINLQTILAREVAPSENAVLTIGSLQAGSASNIIPAEAKLTGTFRTFSAETRAYITKRLVEITEQTAAMFRAKAEVKFPGGCPALITNNAVIDIMGNALKSMLGQENVNDAHDCFSGSEDFAYVTEAVPGAYFVLGADPENGTRYNQHHPNVVFNEDSLPIGAAAYVCAATAWLEANK